MIDALVFPDTRSALFDLIDGHEHFGSTVHAFYLTPADDRGSIKGPFPIAVITPAGGTEGYVDRVERVIVEVYAEGSTAATATLESIRASIVGTDIETPSGYLDRVAVQNVPVETPYQSATLNRATATFEVTTRPINT